MATVYRYSLILILCNHDTHLILPGQQEFFFLHAKRVLQYSAALNRVFGDLICSRSQDYIVHAIPLRHAIAPARSAAGYIPTLRKNAEWPALRCCGAADSGPTSPQQDASLCLAREPPSAYFPFRLQDQSKVDLEIKPSLGVKTAPSIHFSKPQKLQ